MTPEQIELVARQISSDRGLTFEGRVGGGAFKETYRVSGSDGNYGVRAPDAMLSFAQFLVTGMTHG